jgi:hypothetical protein
VCLALLLPLNAKSFSVLTKFRRQGLKFTDQRVKLTSEVLQGSRIIKMQVVVVVVVAVVVVVVGGGGG